MSVAFSTRLSYLRKENNLTQRQAAEDLQISQALLSHYENGIRECNLEFVEKAARYYHVSSDFLLGLSDSETNAGEQFSAGALPEDNEYHFGTLLRALSRLYTAAHTHSKQAEDLFLDYFSLSVKQYVDALRMEPQIRQKLGEFCAAVLLQNGSAAAAELSEDEKQPLLTVEASAAETMNKLLSGLRYD